MSSRLQKSLFEHIIILEIIYSIMVQWGHEHQNVYKNDKVITGIND